MARIERPMKPDYFPVFPLHLLMDEDYEHLGREEWGSVFLLMQHQWVKEGTLPEDRTKLACMARCTPEELDQLLARWPKLQPVEGQPGRVAIPWLLDEYNRAMQAWEEYRERQTENGQKSAEARRAKFGSAQPVNPNHGSNGGSVPGSNEGSNDSRTRPEPPSHPIPTHPLLPEAIASGSPQPKTADGPTVATLPCVGKGPKEYKVTQAQHDEWAQCYPKLDIMQELRGAYAWLRANKTEAKTHSGMPRFLVHWFNRAQNQGGARASPNGQTRAPAIRAGTDAEFLENLNAAKASKEQHESSDGVKMLVSTGAENLF